MAHITKENRLRDVDWKKIALEVRTQRGPIASPRYVLQDETPADERLQEALQAKMAPWYVVWLQGAGIVWRICTVLGVIWLTAVDRWLPLFGSYRTSVMVALFFSLALLLSPPTILSRILQVEGEEILRNLRHRYRRN